MESFSFFNTPKSLQVKVLEKFTDFQLQGRFINVEVSEKAPRGRSGGKRKSSNRSSDSGAGGYKKKFNSSEDSVGGYDRRKRRSFDNNPDKKRKESSSSPRRSKPVYGVKGNKPDGFGRKSRN